MNRRTFLQRTLAAAAAAGATWFDLPHVLAKPGFSPALQASLKKYGGFPMGVQSYSLRAFGIEGEGNALEKIGALDLHWVEFYGGHFPITQDKLKIEAMHKKLNAHELHISAHGVNGFTKNHEKNEKVFQFAKAAGIKNISANPAPDSFDSLDKLVAKYDVRIAIHNHGPGALYSSIEDGLKAVKGHDKRIGFCADLGHYIRSAEDPVEVIHKLGDRLYGIHLKDFAEQKKQTHGVILGKGHLDVTGVFKALKKVGFPIDGALSLEYEENPKNPIADIEECLKVAADGAQKALKG